MKAAFRKNDGTIEMRNIEPRQLSDGEVRVAMDACGICGTDLHGGSTEGEIFGHEVAGRIIELGDRVRHLRIGQQVVLESSSFCGRCENCRDGNVECCTNILSFNHIVNVSLGFAEEMIAPVESVMPYEGLAPEIACLQEPLGVAIDLVRIADVKPNQNVLLIGGGPIGLMALEIIRNTIGVKRFYISEFRRMTGRFKLAGEIGYDAWIEPEDLLSFDFGHAGLDRILVTAPPTVVPDALKLGGWKSKVAYLGVGWTPERACQTINLDDMHFKKQVLAPSYAVPALFGARALDYLKRGVVKGERYISHTYSLTEIAKAMETARHDASAVKVVVK